ncbi:MAG: glucosamine inositolphosphorylceramide transferase family protein [Syntrophobacteraceae bacterium]
MNILGHVLSLYGRLFVKEIYNIGIVHAPIYCFLNTEWKPDISWLAKLPEKPTYIADPFGIQLNDKEYLFCEYFDYRENKGRIICKEMNGTVCSSDFENAIVLSCHTSYPFLFKHDGNLFCVPETSRAKEIALYKLIELPDKWIKEAVLLDGVPAVDASIVPFGAHWWLFYAVENSNSLDLHISHADSLYGPFFPHAKQPVKSDSASSRGAGTPFVHEGKLYRPAQDCSKTYGGRVVINEVVLLSPAEFEERVVSVVEPDENGPYPHGLHTLSALGDKTLVDGKREMFVLAAASKTIQNRVKDILGLKRTGEL